jgi:hypothetical protein
MPTPVNTHLFIPDVQVRPGEPYDHLVWAARWIGEKVGGKKNVTIVCAGDWWDMPSLSSYDRGKKAMEGRRYVEDVAAGNEAMRAFRGVLRDAAPRGWRPRMVFLHGNHEQRIVRAAEDNAQLDGAVSLTHLDLAGWETYDFLVPVVIDGVTYAHYFYHPNTGRPYAGTNVESRLAKIGTSFTMGHQQGLLYGVRSTIRGMQHGLVAGSFYQHNEEYRGPQAQGEWRGIVVKHDVRDGTYDPMFVSLTYLERQYGTP